MVRVSRFARMRCRAPTRTRAPKQPTGLFLSLRECPFESQQQNKNGSCTNVHLPFLVRVSRFELEADPALCAGPAFGRKLKCKRPRVRETPRQQKRTGLLRNLFFGPSVEIRTRGLLNPMEESRLLYCISCGKYVNISIIQNFSGHKYYIFSMCSTPVPFVFRTGFALYQRSHFHKGS